MESFNRWTLAPLVAQKVKSLPAMQETWVRSLVREDPLEKEMATHSSTLAWRIPWTRSLAGYSLWGCKELDSTERLWTLGFGVFFTRHCSLAIHTGC